MASPVIGTRGSALARRQAGHVAAALERIHPGLEAEQSIIHSDGDLDADTPIAGVGERGVFVRRLESALAAGEVDLVVHSLKDMPSSQPEGLAIAAVLERLDPRDALLSLEGWTLERLAAGSRVGTGSPRRRTQILHSRPDLEVVSVRGNIDTRIRKLKEGNFEGLVLALAGLERLGIDDVPFQPIAVTRCVPAVGQGALAVEIRASDAKTRELVAPLNHEPSAICAASERAFLRRLGAGCMAPATAYAEIVDGVLAVEAMVGSADGGQILIEAEHGVPADAVVIGERVARRLLVAGGAAILARARGAEPGHGTG